MSEMGVQVWLLNKESRFLIDRSIVLPPKKFTPTIFCAKYVDDISIAESFNIKETLVPDLTLVQPVSFHERFEMKLPHNRSKVYSELLNIKELASNNQKRVNLSKSQFMLFNLSKNYDFQPTLENDNTRIASIHEMKILGTVVRNDLSWKRNTEMIVSKAYKRLWTIRRLKQSGADPDDLIEIYLKQLRSILGFAVSVWNAGLTLSKSTDIE